tara:strand:- start:398 stop:2554 length:2157 start_codon:yes stop_codon:yes gene_type:complete
MALTTVKSDQIQTSVALAGSPTTTTQSASDNSTKVATTAYVETAVANLVASAPTALNTLDELAAALNDDASFSTTVTNSIATKLPLAGGTMSGALNMGSQNITNAGTIAGGAVTTTSNLSVGTTNTSQFVTILKNHTGYTDIGVLNNTSNSDLYLGVGGSGAGNTDLRNAAYVLAGGASSVLILGTNTDEKMRIDASGNVGIGITPQSFAKLQVKATTNQNVSVFTNSAGLTIGGITDAGGSAALRIAGAPLHLSGGGGGASAGPHLVIDNNGKVGIGISSGLGGLPLQTKVSSGDNKLRMTTANKDAFILELKDASGDVHLGTNTTAGALVIADNGNINVPANLTAQNVIDISTTHSIQTTTANQWATIQNTTASGYSEMRWMNDASNYLIVGTIGSTYSSADWSNSSYIYADRELRIKSTQGIRFFSGGNALGTNDHMLLDQSGNLLVGTADTTLYNNTSGGGINLMASNRFDVARAGDVVATFNRMTDAGQVIQLYQAGSLAGGLGVSGTDATIGTGDTGITFEDAANAVHPVNYTTGAARDNAVDLGKAAARFQNVYLSGGVNFSDATGGTTYSAGNAANTLDDYEEGTWTPTWTGDSSIAVNKATYTKIGNVCYLYLYVSAVLPDTSNAGQTIYGLPFTAVGGAEYPGLTFSYTGSANLHGTFPGITALIAQSNTYIYFHRNDGNTGTVSRAQFRSAAGASDMALILSGCYRV